MRTLPRKEHPARPTGARLLPFCVANFAFCLLPFAFLHATPLSSTATDEEIDASIERALEFIAAGQQDNGRFNSHLGRTVPGISGLCGMAFLAKGYMPGEGKYGEILNRCVDGVLNGADKNGYMSGEGRMYSHAICTLFLGEVSGNVDPERQKRIDLLLPRATKIILNAQAVPKDNNQAGGWRYNPNSNDSDLSCSGWCLMALRSANMNGAPVPQAAFDNAVKYILRRQHREWGCFGYQGDSDYAKTLSGAAILCLALSGDFKRDPNIEPAIARGVRYLTYRQQNGSNVYRDLYKETRCFYGLYYTAQGLFQYGGAEWQQFADWMYEWINHQQTDGSWDRGEEGCKYYQTAMVVLSFAVPYRQLPIYQRDETVDVEE